MVASRYDHAHSVRHRDGGIRSVAHPARCSSRTVTRKCLKYFSERDAADDFENNFVSARAQVLPDPRCDVGGSSARDDCVDELIRAGRIYVVVSEGVNGHKHAHPALGGAPGSGLGTGVRRPSRRTMSVRSQDCSSATRPRQRGVVLTAFGRKTISLQLISGRRTPAR